MTLPPEIELACRELVERVTDWLEGTLSPAERDRFEAHLATCRHCRVYVEQIRLVLRLARRSGRRVDAAALPSETRAALVAAFRGYPSRRNGHATRPTPSRHLRAPDAPAHPPRMSGTPRFDEIEWLARTETVGVRVNTLGPGQATPWHFHTVVADDVFCLETPVEVGLRGPDETVSLAPGQRQRIAPGRVHRVVNRGTGPARYLLVQATGKYDFNAVEG